MRARTSAWLATGMLALAVLEPATAQVGWGYAQNSTDYTGVIVTPYGYIPPRFPNTWIVPNYVFHYDMPRPTFVPLYPERPVVRTVSTRTVPLRDTLPIDMRVTTGTAVVWVNGTDRERTLLITIPGPNGNGPGLARYTSSLRPGDCFSLLFNQRGTYHYSLQDEPEHRARILVQ